MKTKLLLAAMALAFTLPGVAYAGVSFDPDGAGSAPAIDVGTFDWGPTSFAAVGGNSAAAAFVASGGACVAGACDFNVLTHARLIGTFNQAGTPDTPSGLNTTYEITMIARFTETVTGVATLGGDVIASFVSATTQTGAFLQIFFDSPTNAVDVSGSGFNDGRLILSASSIVPGAKGTFSTTPCTGTDCVPLDGHGTDDYPGQLTQTGAGSQGNVTASGIVTDPAFFLTALSDMGLKFANISTGLPFISVDPSDCFSQAASSTTGGIGTDTTGTPLCAAFHVSGPMSANDPDANGGYVPIIGAVNGAFVGTNPDFVAQTDFNSPLTPRAAPEPGSIALLGLGFAGLGFMLRRRNRR